jgi:peptidoglycan lytic transglycosylase G
VLYALGGALGVITLAVLGLILGFGHLAAPDRGGGAVEIDWPGGLSSDEAAALLARHGLVNNEAAMALFLRTTGGTKAFVPGPHYLAYGYGPWDYRRMLERAPARPTTRVVIPEGYNRFDIAVRLEQRRVISKAAFLRASADPLLLDELGIERGGAVGAESAEGYLFPATYDFPLDADGREIVRRMVVEADKRWAALALAQAAGFSSLKNTLGFGRREALTLASMVEKEAAAAEERPIIASVFLNRLLDPDFKPRRLQSDPTSIYGCVVAPEEAPSSCAGFTGKATPAINRDPQNRYSTYVHDGLPPGPIANPGAASIEAVLAPAATKFLYFVAKGGGRHTFSEDLSQHNEAVRKLRPPSEKNE